MAKGKKEISSIEEFLEAIFGESILEETVEPKVGDIILLSNKSQASYLIPVGTNETIGKDFDVSKHKGLLSYFTKSPGIVVKTNLDFKYKCGHCEQEHSHDVVIYFKEINQSFYASSNGLKFADKIGE